MIPALAKLLRRRTDEELAAELERREQEAALAARALARRIETATAKIEARAGGGDARPT